MKAMQYTAFGGPEVIKKQDADKPAPKEKEVLIKVIATTVNPFDMKIRSGNLQQQMPVQFPYTPGLDVSGTIEERGSGATRFAKGDEVFATTFGGTYAEYVVLKEEQVENKPSNVSHNEAAALAVPIVTSYTLLVEEAGLQPGQKILVHGASGGVGSILLQMAKAMGAYVIGTASGEGVNLVKQLGADEAIDYKQQDFTQLVHDADVVADLVGGETASRSFAVLKKGGKLLSTVALPDAEAAKKAGVMAKFINGTPSSKKLAFGKKLVEEGKIKTDIAKTLPLEAAAEGQELVTKGGLNGKVVLEVK